jgi:hypothetical protein
MVFSWALQNEGGNKEDRCGAFSLILVPQEADKGTGAGGLRHLFQMACHFKSESPWPRPTRPDSVTAALRLAPTNFFIF